MFIGNLILKLNVTDNVTGVCKILTLFLYFFVIFIDS